MRCCGTSHPGVWVSAHPDVILKMGAKEVLHRTRHLGWGTDTHPYRAAPAFREEFPPRLLSASRGSSSRTAATAARASGRSTRFADCLRGRDRSRAAGDEGQCAGRPVARRFHATLRDIFRGRRLHHRSAVPAAAIRRHDPLLHDTDKVVGFGHQWVKALVPPPPEGPTRRPGGGVRDHAPCVGRGISGSPDEDGIGMDAPDDAVARYRRRFAADHLGADFLYGPRAASGEDTYVLSRSISVRYFRFPNRRLRRSPDARGPAAVFKEDTRQERTFDVLEPPHRTGKAERHTEADFAQRLSSTRAPRRPTSKATSSRKLPDCADERHVVVTPRQISLRKSSPRVERPIVRTLEDDEGVGGRRRDGEGGVEMDRQPRPLLRYDSQRCRWCCWSGSSLMLVAGSRIRLRCSAPVCLAVVLAQHRLEKQAVADQARFVESPSASALPRLAARAPIAPKVRSPGPRSGPRSAPSDPHPEILRRPPVDFDPTGLGNGGIGAVKGAVGLGVAVEATARTGDSMRMAIGGPRVMAAGGIPDSCRLCSGRPYAEVEPIVRRDEQRGAGARDGRNAGDR